MVAPVNEVYPEPLEVFDWDIQGIPCQIAVTTYIAGEPAGHASFNIHGELTDPGSPEEEPVIEFEIWTADGQYAPWLRQLMSIRNLGEIMREIKRRANSGPTIDDL